MNTIYKLMYKVLARMVIKRVKDENKKYIIEDKQYNVVIRGYVIFFLTMYLLLVSSNNKERSYYLNEIINELLTESWMPVSSFNFRSDEYSRKFKNWSGREYNSKLELI